MANTKVTSRVLANDAVLTANIADDQVTTAKIADDVALGGNPTTTTQSAGNNTTRIATTAFVTTAVANIVDSAPSALDTLNELAAALGDDANFSTTITNSIATKLPLAGGTMTGNIAHASDFTIDAGGDIILDADGGDITFKDGGTEIAHLSNSSSDFLIQSAVNDKDIIFKGVDNSSAITALTLDMSDAGKATFNSSVVAGGTVQAQIAGFFLTENTTDAFSISSNGANGILKIRDEYNSADRLTIAQNGNVGIATTSPEGVLHVHGGDSGSSYTADGADKLIIEHSDSVAIDLRTPASNQALIMFSDGTRSQGLIGYNHSDDSLRFSNSGNQTRMTIKSDGKVGIGTTAPHEMLHVEGADGTEILCAVREDTAGALASLYFKVDSTGTDVRKKAALIFKRDDPGTRGTGTLHICVDGTNDEGSAAIVDSKMHFSADGEISITKGRTNFSAEASAFSPGNHNGHFIDINGQSASGRAATNAQTHRSFLNPNGTVGTIQTNASATSYNTTSDYRLKENVVTDWDGTALLKQLKPSKFNFKADADTTVQGFLAHEVSSIVPQAVSGEKDAVYTAEEAAQSSLAVEGQPNYQQMDHSKLVPLLVKTVQELEARIKMLEDA